MANSLISCWTNTNLIRNQIISIIKEINNNSREQISHEGLAILSNSLKILFVFSPRYHYQFFIVYNNS
ncbi:MAG TPA: hypothetical protein VFV86_09440, partial [Nitrososphaeraceae archaeon]|nr:hypothetical protein [Nitrososphaeraceae archaeon]